MEHLVKNNGDSGKVGASGGGQPLEGTNEMLKLLESMERQERNGEGVN